MRRSKTRWPGDSRPFPKQQLRAHKLARPAAAAPLNRNSDLAPRAITQLASVCTPARQPTLSCEPLQQHSEPGVNICSPPAGPQPSTSSSRWCAPAARVQVPGSSFALLSLALASFIKPALLLWFLLAWPRGAARSMSHKSSSLSVKA